MAANQRGKTLAVHLEACQRDRRARKHEAEDLPRPRRGREEVERLGADGQRQREAELPGAQVEFTRRVIVGIGVAAGRCAGSDRRRGEADAPEQRRGLVDDRRVGVDAQVPLAEAELSERTPGKRSSARRISDSSAAQSIAGTCSQPGPALALALALTLTRTGAAGAQQPSPCGCSWARCGGPWS